VPKYQTAAKPLKKPRVTVILPGKDVAPYVGATLTSLTRQFADRRDIKVVAINDGSRDDTGARMREYGAAFEHFELIENPNAVGLASARNQGLTHVDTDAFAFIDGDDWLAPGRLEALCARLTDLSCDFLRTDHVTVQGRVRLLRRAPFPFRDVLASPRRGILPTAETTMVDYPYAWAGIFHRKVLDSGLAAFPEGLQTAEDRPWIWRLHLRAQTFAVVDAPAVLYRRGIESSLTQVFDRRRLDFVTAFKQTRQIVEADAEADRFMPKLVATTMAVSARHLSQARKMSRADRTLLREGVHQLLSELPPELVAATFHSFALTRRRRLAPFVRKAVAVP
jgi:glycosyltransferase involved in cell wall biosynthesis